MNNFINVSFDLLSQLKNAALMALCAGVIEQGVLTGVDYFPKGLLYMGE